MNGPDWWQGFYPDRELVVLDLLQPLLNLWSTDSGESPTAVTWLPDNFRDMLPIVRLYRGGGAAEIGVLRDPASVQIAVIAETRADSWELMNFIRAMMWTYESGGSVVREDGSITLVDSTAELVGPQQVPELNPDKRMVPMTFRVPCRVPRGLPNYKQIRESLTP